MYRLPLTLILLVSLGLMVGRAQEDRAPATSPAVVAPSSSILSAVPAEPMVTSTSSAASELIQSAVLMPTVANVAVARDDSELEDEPSALEADDDTDEVEEAGGEDGGDDGELAIGTDEADELLLVQGESGAEDEALVWDRLHAAIDIRVFDLQHMQAGVAAKMISQLFSEDDLIVQSDERTNRLIVRTNPVLQDKVADVIKQMDQPAKAASQSSDAVKEPETKTGRKVMVLEDQAIVTHEGDAQGGVNRRVEIRRMVPAAGTGGPVVWYRNAQPDIQPLRIVADQGQHELAILAEQIRQLRAATEPDEEALADLEEQLKDRVGEVFDARQQLQRAELAVLQQQLNAIEQTIAARERMKDQLVDKRIEEILSDKPPVDVLRLHGGPAMQGDVDVLIPRPESTNLEGHRPVRPPLVAPPRPPHPPTPTRPPVDNSRAIPGEPGLTPDRNAERQMVTQLQMEVMERIKAVEEALRHLGQQPESDEATRVGAALKAQLAATQAEFKALAAHQAALAQQLKQRADQEQQAKEKQLELLEQELERASRQLEETIERSKTKP